MLARMTASPKPAPRKPNPAAELAGSIAARLDRPVVLVGLMGSGKSAVGRRTAKQLGIGFKDSDQLIVKAAGISIAEIFELAGEVKFREMERKTLGNLALASPQIIATGGGAFCQDSHRRSAFAPYINHLAKGVASDIAVTHWQYQNAAIAA